MQKLILSFLLLATFLAGCQYIKKDKEKSTPLAEVNGDVLTLEGFRSTFTDEQWSNLTEEQKKQEIEDWVNITLLSQEAEAQDIDNEKSIQQRIEYARKKIKANALISKRLAGISIGEEELFNYYRLHQGDFQTKLMEYDVQRILCKDAATAGIVLKRILNDGYDFNQAVSEQSLESLREKQGRMGFVTSAGEDSLFWRAAHELKENMPGLAVIEGQNYIIRVISQREGTQDANFEEYRSEIRDILLREKKQQVYNDLVRELKMKANGIYYY
jgi:hypothetical protein